MQVIGLTPAFVAIDVIAERSTRTDVAAWADRVIKRHVRRTPELHRRLTDEKAVRAAAKLDNFSPEVVDRILSAMRAGDEIYAPEKVALSAFIERGLDTMDFMESLPDNDRRIRRIERLSWLDAEKMSENWHAALARVRVTSKGIMDGVRKIAELSDGSFVGELTSAAALKAEGDAMGHCVGGYWRRVSSGDTRIVSLRDKNAAPHVTIELARSHLVEISGREPIRILSRLHPGEVWISPTNVVWYATQIRGKQNRQPIEKYQRSVIEWMAQANIPSNELNYAPETDEGFVAYAVPKHKNGSIRSGYTISENPDEVLPALAELVFDWSQNAKEGSSLKSLISLLRLEEIVCASRNDNAVFEFMEKIVFAFHEKLRLSHQTNGVNAFRSYVESGIEQFVAICKTGRDGGGNPLEGHREFVASLDAGAEIESIQKTVIKINDANEMISFNHKLPMLGLALMEMGMANGLEEKILNILEPKLRKLLDTINQNPDCYHVISSSVPNVVRRQNIIKAFLACGLGDEYASTLRNVQSSVRSHVRSLVMVAKKARTSGQNANVALNLLSEGFEARLPNYVADKSSQDPLILGPEAPKPMMPMRRTAETPKIGSYRMPGR